MADRKTPSLNDTGDHHTTSLRDTVDRKTPSLKDTDDGETSSLRDKGPLTPSEAASTQSPANSHGHVSTSSGSTTSDGFNPFGDGVDWRNRNWHELVQRYPLRLPDSPEGYVQGRFGSLKANEQVLWKSWQRIAALRRKLRNFDHPALRWTKLDDDIDTSRGLIQGMRLANTGDQSQTVQGYLHPLDKGEKESGQQQQQQQQARDQHAELTNIQGMKVREDGRQTPDHSEKHP
ncbi:unnamed protein product [Jaminaea pallidilutea]